MLGFISLVRQLPPGLRRSVLKRLDHLGLDDRLASRGVVQYRYQGRRIQVDLADRVGRQMFKDGLSEQPFIALVRQHFTDPNGCFVDIGANLGNYSLALAPHYLKTVAFEPNPAVFPLLEHNIAANPGLKIVPIARALSCRRQSRLFFPTPHGNSGASGFERQRPEVDPLELETAAGDDYAQEFAPRVAAIKIDVEGHELDVLRGLEATIAHDRPAIFMEWLTHTMAEKGGFDALQELLPDYRILVPAPRRKAGQSSEHPGPKHRFAILTPLRTPYRSKYNLIFCVPAEKAAAVTTD